MSTTTPHNPPAAPVRRPYRPHPYIYPADLAPRAQRRRAGHQGHQGHPDPADQVVSAGPVAHDPDPDPDPRVAG